MGASVAVDTWAFLEVALEKPQGPRVAALMDESDRAFTTRDVVAETFSALLHRTRSGDVAWAWWEDLRRSRVRVYEPPIDEVHAFAAGKMRGSLSLVDLGLAHVALRERALVVASGDAEFRRLGLDPVFAP